MKLSELHYLQLLDETRQEAIRPNKANFYHYFKEIERRLEEGEKAIKELEDLKLSYESFVGHHEATMEDLESLKCCGNCDNRAYFIDGKSCVEWCCKNSKLYPSEHYCPLYQPDGLSQKERTR